MRVAYFINAYPKVSHTFIRREILALERLGLTVDRFALRGWDSNLVDPSDLLELERTRFVLKAGVVLLVVRALAVALARPRCFSRAFKLMWRIAQGSDRSLAHHLASLFEAATLLKWMSARNSLHLHAHFGTNSAEVAMLARALGGPPYSFTIHGSEEWDGPGGLKISDKVQHAAFVVAVSSFTRAQIFRWARSEDWNKIHVVHCGVDQRFIDAAVEPLTGSQRFVCVGRLAHEKAQTLLVEAVAQLHRLGAPVELVLAGDGETRPDIESLIARHGLREHVHMLGSIDNAQVRAEIRSARALILPSLMEALPVVLMEAMALGRPVICTDVGAVRELVRDGQDGWIVPAGSVGSLVSAMRTCMGSSLDSLEEMGRSGRARVLTSHSADLEAAKLLRLFGEKAAVSR